MTNETIYKIYFSSTVEIAPELACAHIQPHYKRFLVR